MAVGDRLTLIKTESGIPWHIAFGAMQHLTPATARTMLRVPWFSWASVGIPVNLEITRIPVQPTMYNRGPMISFGLSGISGVCAKVQDGTNIIEQEGNISANCETQCLETSFGANTPVIVYGGYIRGDKVTMFFYTNENNDVYISLSYGISGNMTTAFDFLYSPLDNLGIVRNVSTSFNNYTYPSFDKNLYCGNDVIEQYFACAALSNLYKACSFDFKVSCDMYATSAGINKRISTGDDSENIENLAPQPETPAEDRKTELYYKSTIYKRVDGVQKDVKVGESNITFVVQYKSNDGTENYPAIGQVAGYVNDFSPVNTSTWGNIKWKKSSNAKIVQIKVDYTGEDGVRHSQTYQPLNFPYNTKNYGFYESYQNGTIRYYSKYTTNMRIYANEGDIDSYLGGNPTVKPLYDGNTGKISPTDYIGDPVVYNEIDYTVDADMSSCWILTKEEVDELAEVFATGLTKEEGDDNTLINITKTCARSFMAQSEPIDAVVDLFWLPIDVTGFCTSENDNMTFSYDRYGILNGAKTIIDGTGETMTVAESNTLRIGDGIGKLFNPINNLSTNIGATIGSAGSTSEVINTYSGTTPTPSIE